MTTTAIEWTDKVWNPVKEGQCHEGRLLEPLKWRKPCMVFVNSMSDLFHPDVPFEFIDKVFAVMALAEKQTFQVLTKRPGQALEYFNRKNIESVNIDHTDLVSLREEIGRWAHTYQNSEDSQIYPEEDYSVSPWPLPNVWLGVSVEDQKTADARIPKLLECPAAVRFVSYEPALGLVDFENHLSPAKCPKCGRIADVNWLDDDGIFVCPACGDEVDWPGPGIDWIIAGGESGPKARPSHPGWFRQARYQCAAAKVAFFFKQWGEWIAGSQLPQEQREWYAKRIGLGGVHVFDGDNNSGNMMVRVGKKRAGRLLDGVEHNAMPET